MVKIKCVLFRGVPVSGGLPAKRTSPGFTGREGSWQLVVLRGTGAGRPLPRIRSLVGSLVRPAHGGDDQDRAAASRRTRRARLSRCTRDRATVLVTITEEDD